MSRQCWTTAGLPKRRWTSRADAKAALARYRNEGLDVTGQQPYRCPDCGYFHLGHYPTSSGIREMLRSRHQQQVAS